MATERPDNTHNEVQELFGACSKGLRSYHQYGYSKEAPAKPRG